MFAIFAKIKEFIMGIFNVNGNLSIDASNVYVDGVRADLSVCHIGTNEYHDLVVNDACLSNVIYVVENDFVDAYGLQVKNVAEPTENTDAATKGYVDAHCCHDDEFISRREFDEFKGQLSTIIKENVKALVSDF